MKNKVSLLCAMVIALCAFIITPSLKAQGTIASSDNLRTYALKQVKRGFISLQSPSMDYSYSGGVTSTEVSGSYAEEVLAKLGAVEFIFRLTNPNDVVNGYLYLYDQNDNLLFFGSTQFTLADLATGKPKYNIWIQEIPLFSSVESAQVLALNSDGTTGGQINNLRVNENGQLFFPPWMTGIENGLLVVKYRDGTVVSYPLADPQGGFTPEVSREKSEFAIQGHYVFKDPTSIKILELWNKPTVYLELTADNTVITFDVAGVLQNGANVEFERPLFMYYDNDLGSGVTYLRQEPTAIGFPRGIYRLRFQWREFGKPGLLYTGPSDGGGKG